MQHEIAPAAERPGGRAPGQRVSREGAGAASGSTADPGAQAGADPGPRFREIVRIPVDRGTLRRVLVVAGCLVGHPSPASMAGGALALAAGAALHLGSKGCLQQNRRLTTCGPYRYCRHPFYAANLLVDAGICVAVDRWYVTIPYLLLWTIVYGHAMRREERRLLSLFGDAYPAYAERVPRLLPVRRPLPRAAAPGGFSWSNPNLAAGREYSRLAGLAIALPLIWIAFQLRTLGLPEALQDPGVAAALVVLAGLRWLQMALLRRRRRSRRGGAAGLRRLREALATAPRRWIRRSARLS